MPDTAQYDFFATQFATSIVNESGKAETYWFGRMLRYIDSDEFEFRNFFGTDYTEDEFRKQMSAGVIDVTVFNISNVSYTPDPNDPTLATATCDVEIEAVINNVRKSGNFTLTHKIKQGWQTYESTLS
jgi:hypothetical protein